MFLDVVLVVVVVVVVRVVVVVVILVLVLVLAEGMFYMNAFLILVFLNFTHIISNLCFYLLSQVSFLSRDKWFLFSYNTRRYYDFLHSNIHIFLMLYILASSESGPGRNECKIKLLFIQKLPQ